MSKDKEEPAFPTEQFDFESEVQRHILCGGLTKREWFAGMALSGNFGKDGDAGYLEPKRVAAFCFETADAMIEASKK